ncbi:hypothetical protein C1O28_13085 [Rathayibacter rathayi]|nr:hypothetical protein C1O28_13085 [Rathayibacter rathayi]
MVGHGGRTGDSQHDRTQHDPAGRHGTRRRGAGRHGTRRHGADPDRDGARRRGCHGKRAQRILAGRRSRDRQRILAGRRLPAGARAHRPLAAHPPPQPTDPPPVAENRFVLWLRGLDLPRRPGWIGGVCAGIADRLGIDPLIVRGIVLVVAVLGGPALLLYAAAWLLLPDQDGALPVARLLRGSLDRVHAAIGALVLASMLPVAQGFWSLGSAYAGAVPWAPATGGTLWSLVVLGLIVAFVVWVVRRSRRSDDAAAPYPAEGPSATRPYPTASPPPRLPRARPWPAGRAPLLPRSRCRLARASGGVARRTGDVPRPAGSLGPRDGPRPGGGGASRRRRRHRRAPGTPPPPSRREPATAGEPHPARPGGRRPDRRAGLAHRLRTHSPRGRSRVRRARARRGDRARRAAPQARNRADRPRDGRAHHGRLRRHAADRPHAAAGARLLRLLERRTRSLRDPRGE